MKKTWKSRVLSGAVAGAIVLSGFSALSVNVLASWVKDTRAENTPYQHGYRPEDIMNWSPETDTFADLQRAQIPLQKRNEAFAQTQADPTLTSEAQYFNLAADYGQFDSLPYSDEFSQHVFNHWQYIDYYASWHGLPTEGSYESGNGNYSYAYEWGILNLPNAGYTNAAHKNGVLSIGCIFQPRANQTFESLLYTDDNGRYLVADKLTEIAKYYGFDGYFFNMEDRVYDDIVELKLKEFFAQLRENGMYIQWYNSDGFSPNMLTSATENNTENATLYANSMFLEYGADVPGDEGTLPYGLNKYEAAFNGFEAGGARWTNDFSRLMSNGIMNGSIASLGAEFVQVGMGSDLGDESLIDQDNQQWKAFERANLWWTGNNRTDGPNANLSVLPSVLGANDFKGVSNYIAERSVISGDTFYTNFNTGHGLEYAVNGVTSSNAEWSNITIQDIPLTWQWWIDTQGSKLFAEFDYGTKYEKADTEMGFIPVGAYNGGSSLVLYGTMDALNEVHLYKTDLAVKENSKFAVTFKKTSADTASMKLGIIFKDAPEKTEVFEIEKSESKSEDWITSIVDLSGHAGREIAAISLIVDGTAENYQMNIGQIQYTSNDKIVPKTPTGLTIEKAYETGEMTLSWDMEAYDQVKQYNVYALKDGREIFLGGTYDENFYIKNINEAIVEADRTIIDSVTVSPKEVDAQAGDTVDFDATVNGYEEKAGQITIVLKAVSADGTESEGAVASNNYAEAVKNVTVDNFVDGKLTLTWEGGEANVVVKTSYEEEERTWTAAGNNGCVVTVPTGAEANGAAVTVTIVKENGNFITVDTTLPDKYCLPYDGRVYGSDGRLTQPSTKEWHELYFQSVKNGVRAAAIKTVRDGEQGINNNTLMPQVLNSADGLYVWLVDYNGNVSEEVYIPNRVFVSISEGPDTVDAGTSAQYYATVENYKETDAVRWRILGNQSPETTIDENGLLTVAADEGAAQITVLAEAKEDQAAVDYKFVKITSDYVLMSDSKYAYKGQDVSCYVYGQGKKFPTEDYTWSVGPKYSWNTLSKDTTITNGVLHVAMDETVYEVTVKAKKGDLEYTLDFIVQDVYGIDPSFAGVALGGTQQFSMKNNMTGESCPASDFTWSVTGNNSTETKIDANGLFTMGLDENSYSINVVAKHNASGAVSSASVYISSNAIAGMSMKKAMALAPTQSNVALTALQEETSGVQDNQTVSQEVVWTVQGATSVQTKVDENGTLIIGVDETAAQLFVTATSAVDGTKYDTAVVNITQTEKCFVEVIAGEHGTVTPGSGEYDKGSNVTFTFTPDEGYVVEKVLVDGEEVTLTDCKYTLTVMGTTQIEVTFKADAVTPDQPEAPDTGDYTPILLSVLLTVLAAAGIMLYVKRRHMIK